MLATGRLATLRRWQEFSATDAERTPISSVIEAEIAFREGRHAEAEAIATEALVLLPSDHPLRPRVLFRAGQAAYFLGHEAAALDFLNAATDAATDPDFEKEVRWAAFITALDLDPSRATDYLDDFEQARKPTIDDSVRLANARILTAIRCGGISGTLEAVDTTAKVVAHARDAMIKTAFLHVFGVALAHNAQYERAIDTCDQERREADLAGLSFVYPHAALLEALARVGRRDADEALRLIDEVASVGSEREDTFLSLSANLVDARLRLMLRRPLPTVAGLAHESVKSCRLTYGELLAVHAVAVAAVGDEITTFELVQRVRKITNHAETRALTALALVLVKLAQGDRAVGAVGEAISLVRELGHLDSLVTAYRAFPPLVEIAADAGHEALVERLLEASNDERMARVYGLGSASQDGAATLSVREREVLGLVASGKTNDEVATALFISPVTVKAHLRHIYEKLGVRNRVEAAALATELPSQRG
jgi:ATP/maltotriose-dependent transcriptional regulator MalT